MKYTRVYIRDRGRYFPGYNYRRSVYPPILFAPDSPHFPPLLPPLLPPLPPLPPLSVVYTVQNFRIIHLHTKHLHLVMYMNIGLKTVYVEVFEVVLHFPRLASKKGRIWWTIFRHCVQGYKILGNNFWSTLTHVQ